MSHLITQNGLEELVLELKKIKEKDLPSTLESLNLARKEGDLKENATYQTALKVKDELEYRISEIENILNDYEIIKEGISKNNKVSLGSNVKIELLNQKQILEVQIVGSSESNILKFKVGNNSPLVNAILNKTVGDILEYRSPSGKVKVKILEVK